jgi:hypothetical protein
LGRDPDADGTHIAMFPLQQSLQHNQKDIKESKMCPHSRIHNMKIRKVRHHRPGVSRDSRKMERKNTYLKEHAAVNVVISCNNSEVL